MHPPRRPWTEPLGPKQPGNPRDADPIKDRLRPHNLQYRLKGPVNDRRSRNKRQIAPPQHLFRIRTAIQHHNTELLPPNIFHIKIQDPEFTPLRTAPCMNRLKSDQCDPRPPVPLKKLEQVQTALSGPLSLQ